jgi:outer membrane protein assembly factor BamB
MATRAALAQYVSQQEDRMGMPLRIDDLLFIGIKGTVLALHRATGEEIWRTKLKGADFTNLTREGDLLLAATHGELFCLDVVDGRIRWHNPLRGMGFGIVTFASSPENAAAARKLQADAEAAHASQMTTMTTTAT